MIRARAVRSAVERDRRRQSSAGWLVAVAASCAARTRCRSAPAAAHARCTTGSTSSTTAVGANRNSNPLFLYFFNEIRLVIDEFVTFVQALIAQPSFGRPAAADRLARRGRDRSATWPGRSATGGSRCWPLAGFVFLGLQGLWQESMDTLALTLAAVLISLLIGIPLGIWAGLSDRFNRIITPVLDFMQTMPTFVYLAPLTLFFLIGPASATIATLIYATPPVIRITAHGIRAVPHDTVEASESLGSTTKADADQGAAAAARKRTIVLGVNQTIMAALAMVTIAALIDAPGLGKTVMKALQTLDVGTAFNAGLAIVVMAIVLDRVTTAAATRGRQPLPQLDRLVGSWRQPSRCLPSTCPTPTSGRRSSRPTLDIGSIDPPAARSARPTGCRTTCPGLTGGYQGLRHPRC